MDRFGVFLVGVMVGWATLFGLAFVCVHLGPKCAICKTHFGKYPETPKVCPDCRRAIIEESRP